MAETGGHGKGDDDGGLFVEFGDGAGFVGEFEKAFFLIICCW